MNVTVWYAPRDNSPETARIDGVSHSNAIVRTQCAAVATRLARKPRPDPAIIGAAGCNQTIWIGGHLASTSRTWRRQIRCQDQRSAMRRISQSTLGLLCVIVVVVAHAAHEAFGPDDDIKQYLASPNGGNVTAVLVTAQAQLDDLVNFLCTSRTVCPMLKAIKASGPLITHLSWQVGSLTFLTSLDISNTGVSRLPWQVGSMTSLESLDISNTPIDTLPWQIGRLASLISLDISGTRITELPYQIGFLTGLQYFNCDPGLKGVPDGIAPLHHPATAVEQAPAPVQSTPDFGSVVLPNRFDDAPVGVLCSQYQVYADMVVTLEALLARWVDQPVPDNVVTAATFVRECIAECRATQAQIENRMRDLGFAPADCG